ncbi:MAG: circadian clock KaiB family protein [Acidobacteria bacterium]|nr:circadian clock KaiB family protein [Acidobacteriota bacterium]
MDDFAAFERALDETPQADSYVLRLYVTGSTPRSIRAIENIRAICEDKLHGRYDLEVIDLYQHPELARSNQIVVAPTLVKTLPRPVRKLIGDLSDRDRVLAGLDIRPARAPKKEGI